MIADFGLLMLQRPGGLLREARGGIFILIFVLFETEREKPRFHCPSPRVEFHLSQEGKGISNT